MCVRERERSKLELTKNKLIKERRNSLEARLKVWNNLAKGEKECICKERRNKVIEGGETDGIKRRWGGRKNKLKTGSGTDK